MAVVSHPDLLYVSSYSHLSFSVPGTSTLDVQKRAGGALWISLGPLLGPFAMPLGSFGASLDRLGTPVMKKTKKDHLLQAPESLKCDK